MIIIPMDEKYIKKSKYDSIQKSKIPDPVLKPVKSENNNEAYTRLEELDIQLQDVFNAVKEHQVKLASDSSFSNNVEILEALNGFMIFFKPFNQYARERCINNKNDCCQTEYSPERIQYLALMKTHEAWRLLLQVINQRYSPIYSYYLYQIDQNLKAHGLLEKSRIFTDGKDPVIYFDKLFGITRYPFHVHPFISVPIDRVKLDGKSAICHELGHHVFWNNGSYGNCEERIDSVKEIVARTVFPKAIPISDSDNQLEIKEQLEMSLAVYETLVSWAEEIIADIYAILLIGPEYAKKSQDMVARRVVGAAGGLNENDGEHPMPILRPYIVLKVLNVVNEKLKKTKSNKDFKLAYGSLIASLEKRWHDFYISEGVDLAEELEANISNNLTLNELKKYLEEFVEELLDAPLFYTVSQAKNRVSLLGKMEYWGKKGTTEEKYEISELKELLLNDERNNEVEPIVSNNDSTLVVQDSDSFDDFLKYMHGLNLKPKQKKLLCEDIVNFDFIVSYYGSLCSRVNGVSMRKTASGLYRICSG